MPERLLRKPIDPPHASFIHTEMAKELAFDPKGRLFVGSIIKPGWVSQPDHGVRFSIVFTTLASLGAHGAPTR